MVKFLSSKAVTQRLTENERWRAMGMLQNGSIQLNVARHFNVSQTVISSSGTWTPTSGTIGHISSLLMAVPLSADGNGKSELIPTLKKKKKSAGGGIICPISPQNPRMRGKIHHQVHQLLGVLHGDVSLTFHNGFSVSLSK